VNTERANRIIAEMVERGISHEVANDLVWGVIDDVIMDERRDAEMDAEIRERDMAAQARLAALDADH
jgi:hypothetical protein